MPDPGHRMCVDCGNTIAPGEVEYDPETDEGPLCVTCLEDRGTDPNFDFGESDELED